MKAAVIYEFGPPDVLKIEDAAPPKPAEGEVLVRVHAVRVGGLLDIGTRAGRNPFARLAFPHILGADFAGDVAEVGEGVSVLKPGDRVAVSPFVACGKCPACQAGRDYGCPSAQLIGVHRPGSYAELVSVPAKVVRRIPDAVTYEQAAAMALSGPVAFTQFSVVGLKPGDWVLVCSDGLSNHISAIMLKEMLLSEAQSAEMAARRLVNLTNIEGATDNATVVVVRLT